MKTIAILLFAGSISHADIVTIYSPGADDYTPVSPPSYVICTSFDFTLNNSTWLTTSETLPDSVLLQNLTIYGRQVDKGFSGGLGIAIFQKNQTSTWDFVGKSSWNNAPYGPGTLVGSNPFDFEDLKLSTNVTYTAVFYGKNSTFNYLKEGSTITSLEGTTSSIIEWADTPIAAPAIGVTSTNSHENIYKENGTLYDETDKVLMPGYEDYGIYISGLDRLTPVISFTLETLPNVPEPTTSSLSLLGLATLMMHRRRV